MCSTHISLKILFIGETSRKWHVRGLTKIPDMLHTNKWFEKDLATIEYSNYYPTIGINMTSLYANRKN